MSVPCEEPTAVVGVGESVRSARAREALLEGIATDLIVVDTPADALECLEDRDDVGCVVTARSLSGTDATGLECCRAVREYSVDLPVVFYVAEDAPDPDAVRRALNAGAAGYYTGADPLAELRDAVDDAIETYDRRRVAAAESDAFTTVLEDLGVNIYVKDDQARYLRAANVPDSADAADSLGKTDLDVYGDNDPETARAAYEDDLRVIETGEPIYEKDERYGTDRTAHVVRTTKVPWTDDDGTTKGLVGITFDITALKHQATELEALRDRFDRFASNVRHELKNPLQVASGHLELGRKTGDGESLAHAATALERIEEVLNDLESIATDEAGDPAERTRTLEDLVEDVWTVLRTDAATLENEFPPSARTATGTETLRPVFENLFKNALTHGEPDVTVRIGPLEDGFYVEDTGPGIPESEREAVLEAGYTTASEGDGMGLTLVADVCNQRGWTLEIGRSPEGGARFEITNCPLIREPTADDREDVRKDPGLGLDAETAVGTLEGDCGAEYDPARNRWAVTADGANIWRHWNDFYFVHTVVEGPVSIRARVVDIEGVDPFSKAGVMVRDELTEDASYGYVGATPGFGTEMLWRTRRGEEGISQQLREAERSEWFRVDLLEGTATCFVSQDGQRWVPIDQRPIDRTGPVYAGLAVCSVVAGHPCTAQFEDVSVVDLAVESADD
ncbi:ATP-binding protein [Halopiger aswanensis]|nr:ATP-binding protein [Halopiger aswanensis]